MQIHPKGHEGQAPKEFGFNANILKTRRFNLGVARNLEEIEIGGSCLWALAATSLTASIDVYINDQLRDPVTFQQGMFIRGIPFSRIYVSHTAQPGETITLFFAVEEDVRNIQIINPSLAFTEVNLTKATFCDTLVDVNIAPTASLRISPGNPLSRDYFLTSLSSNIFILRIGNGDVAAARGIELAPGETILVKHTAIIRAYNPGSIPQTLGCMWTED